MHNFIRNLGIGEDYIIGHSLDEWLDYDGEEVILVVSNITLEQHIKLASKFSIVNFGIENFGKKIDDINSADQFINNMDSYLGCRDEYNFNVLSGIQNSDRLYINGCMTIALPQKREKLGDSIYLVDIPVELLEYIPKDILSNALIRTHEYYYEENIPANKEIEKLAINQYKEYYVNARLVITSRLHLAAPCVAWGIPVILVRKNPYITFSWIDKFIPIYTPHTYKDIIWEPERIDIEEYKKVILRDMTYILMKKYYENSNSLDVHKIYSGNREFEPKEGYYTDLIDGLKRSLKNDFDCNDKIEYAVWGITFNAEKLYSFLKENFPNFILKYAIDRYNRTVFHGMNTITPDIVADKLEGIVVIVIPTGAVQEARIFLEGKGCRKVYFVTEVFATRKDIETAIEERINEVD